MSLQAVNADNFSMNGRTMMLKARGAVVVLFKIAGCHACSEMEPIFTQLSKKDRRVSFAIIDATTDKRVFAMAKNSTTPIKGVPTTILYIDGRPIATSTGKRGLPALQGMITKGLESAPAAQTVPNNQPFAPPQPPAQFRGPNTAPAPRAQFGGPQSKYAPMGGNFADDYEGDRLAIPDSVVPHNAPWTAYRHLGGGEE